MSATHPSPQTPKAEDPRTQNTRSNLIECAEALVAELGVEGVSLRQIAKVSGSANSSVVAYHFGDKASLLRAVIDHRLPAIDAQRGALLAAAKQVQATPDLPTLLAILYRPFLEQISTDGKHSYARFVAELMRAGVIDIRVSLYADYPHTGEVIERMKQALSPTLQALFGQRIVLCSVMICATIRQIDLHQLDAHSAEQQFADALVMAAAALAAPPSNA